MSSPHLAAQANTATEKEPLFRSLLAALASLVLLVIGLLLLGFLGLITLVMIAGPPN
jgi:hypothetical protein